VPAKGLKHGVMALCMFFLNIPSPLNLPTVYLFARYGFKSKQQIFPQKVEFQHVSCEAEN
jgi:hypothetical protein